MLKTNIQLLLRKSVPLKIQDINNQQTLYINDNNSLNANNQQRSRLFIEEWKKNVIIKNYFRR